MSSRKLINSSKMKPLPFSQIEFEHIIFDTPRGNIGGLFSELRVDAPTIPKGLFPYDIRYSDHDDSVPATIESFVSINYFGTVIVNAPLDFGESGHIEIFDWNFDCGADGCPEWDKQYTGDKAPKSFIDYFVEKMNIDTRGVETIRTCGWGNGAVLIVEYAEFHKEYKPVGLARQYLLEMYDYAPKRLNFNNAHHDRIGCSVINVYDVGREDFDKYSSLPAVAHSEFDEAENWGSLEFPIHNERQLELSYERRLYEYFQG